MKRILLSTVACFFDGVNARDLDGRYEDSSQHDWLIISRVAGVLAAPWQMGKPSLTPIGNQETALRRPP
jgi:hypothetical protein